MEWMYLVPALPSLGAILLVLFSGKTGKAGVIAVGCGSMGLAALITVIAGWQFMQSGLAAYDQHLWEWVRVGDFSIGVNLRLDALSLAFTFVITFVGWLIHIYSTGYMAEDPDFARFFACMNLFVGSMLMLVLADNLLLMYLGWEGVGLCSYLLIGFWYKDPPTAPPRGRRLSLRVSVIRPWRSHFSCLCNIQARYSYHRCWRGRRTSGRPETLRSYG